MREKQQGVKEWARVSAELETKGEKLNWSAFVPNPIPDEINFAKAPAIVDILYRDGPTSNLRRQIRKWDHGMLAKQLADPDERERSNMDAISDGLTLPVTWEGLADRGWKEEQLVELEFLLGAKDWLRALQQVFRSERAAVIGLFERVGEPRSFNGAWAPTPLDRLSFMDRLERMIFANERMESSIGGSLCRICSGLGRFIL